MSLSRRIGSNALAQIGGRLLTSLMAFAITALVLPRLLDEAGYGVFAFHLALYQLLASVLDFGAGTIVVRDVARDRDRAGRLIGALVLIKAAVGLLGALVLAVVALAFEGAGARGLILVLAALHLLFHAPAGATVIFHVDMAFGRHVLAFVLGQTAWLLATLLLAAGGVREPALYALAFGLGPVVNGVCGYAWARRLVRPRFDAARAELARVWREAWPAGVSMAMASVYFSIDSVLLRPLAGEVAVAHYSAAYRLMAFGLMVPVLFSQVVFPVFSRLSERGPDALRPFYLRTLTFLFALGAIFPATVPWVAGDVMALVYPAEYAPGAPALAILSGAIVLVFCAYPHVLALLAAGQQRVMMAISTLGALLNVLLNLLWIPSFGIEGSAWATVATEGFVLLAAASMAHRRAGVRPGARLLLRPAACALGAASVLAWAVPALVTAGPPTRFLVAAAVGVLALAAARVLPLDLGTEAGAP